MGILGSSDMIRLAEGKEAIAWKDNVHPYVYKLFNLYLVDGLGHLGQKIEFRMDGDFECSASFVPADLAHIVDKLRILHQIGACPTEIVGLTEGGYFLVAKQPFCLDYEDLETDRREATRLIRAVVPTGSYQQQIAVFWADGKTWAIGDLHRGNIRRMKSGIPTIIDAMIGEIPTQVLNRVSALGRAAMRAKQWKETGKCPPPGGLSEGSDDEL